MIISLDTETYKQYDGTRSCLESIRGGAIGETKEMCDRKELEKGRYYPVLDAREFMLGCAIVEQQFNKPKYFTSNCDMFNWLDDVIDKNIERKKRTFIYAHNMPYDYYAICKDKLLDNDSKHICFNPFITIRKKKGYFLDTMAFFRCGLDKVGEDLGYKKGELPPVVDSTMELHPYLTRDVEIVSKAIHKLKSDLNSIGFRPMKFLTAGQLAMTSFMTYCRRNGSEKYFTEWNEEKKIRQIVKCKNAEVIRPASRGGDVTAFETGYYDKLDSYDINGFYGEVMRTLRFADLKTERFWLYPALTRLKNLIQNDIGVVKCTVEAPTMELGVLPIRYHTRKGDYMLFPTNRTLKGIWTFEEMKEALKFGYKIGKVEWCVSYKELFMNPLEGFINELWELEKIPSKKGSIKLIRNNVPGKWLQWRLNKEYYYVSRGMVDRYLNEGWKVEGFFGNTYVVSRAVSNYEPPYVNAMIGISITARGRVLLRRILRKIEYPDLKYCDTDGWLNTNEHGDYYDMFNIGEGLGQTKVVHKGKPAKILGEKRYCIGKTIHVSGVPKRNLKLENLYDNIPVETKRMIGIKDGFKIGNMWKVGSFRNKTISMEEHSKMDLPVPEYFDETLNLKKMSELNEVY